jgi:hypothetical protein
MAAWYKFDKYYQKTDETPIHVASILLHPGLRRHYLETEWIEISSYIQPSISAVRESLWEAFFKPARANQQAQSQLELSDKHLDNGFKKWRAAKLTQPANSGTEFDDFISVRIAYFERLKLIFKPFYRPNQPSYPKIPRLYSGGLS